MPRSGPRSRSPSSPAVNVVGVKPGSRLLNVLVLLKLGALAALIVGGLLFSPRDSALRSAGRRAAAPGRLVAFGAALVPILFAYGGWQSVNILAEETREPRRTLPRALLAGTAIVLVVYLLANVVYLPALGHDGLAATTTPAADAVRRIFGPRRRPADRRGDRGVGVRVPRPDAARADAHLLRDGRRRRFLPALGRLHPRFQTPALAILLQAAWGIVLVLTGTYGELVDSVVFGDWIFFGLTVAAVFRFRRRFPIGAGAGRLSDSRLSDLSGALRPGGSPRRGERDSLQPEALRRSARSFWRPASPSTSSPRGGGGSRDDPRPRALHGVGEASAGPRDRSRRLATCSPARSTTCRARARRSSSPAKVRTAIRRSSRRSRNGTAWPPNASRRRAAARAPTSSRAPH